MFECDCESEVNFHFGGLLKLSVRFTDSFWHVVCKVEGSCALMYVSSRTTAMHTVLTSDSSRSLQADSHRLKVEEKAKSFFDVYRSFFDLFRFRSV